jgi:hypothetical protein
MAHDVFISYSSQDKTVANAVCAKLENRKIRCWIAPRDILPGVSFAEALIEALNQSRLIVLVFSTNSNNSQQVMREVERAVNKGIPILPLRIDDVTPTKAMEYYLSTPHWLDAMNPPLERHLERLGDTVIQLLGNVAGPAIVEEKTENIPKQPTQVNQKKQKKSEKSSRYTAVAIILPIIIILGTGIFFLFQNLGTTPSSPTTIPTLEITSTPLASPPTSALTLATTSTPQASTRIPAPTLAIASSPPALAPTPVGLSFKSDFENGKTEGWLFSYPYGVTSNTEWMVIQENGNHILKGTGPNRADAGSRDWGDYSFSTRVNFDQGHSNISFRVGDYGRYYLLLYADGLELVKSSNMKAVYIASVKPNINPNQWYSLQTELSGANIKVYLDEVLQFQYTDPEPLLKGAIAFQPDWECHLLIDDVQVIPAVEIDPRKVTK